jgi:hypothetical protein
MFYLNIMVTPSGRRNIKNGLQFTLGPGMKLLA